MKKIIILFFAVWLGSTDSVKGTPKTLYSQIIDETPIHSGMPKSPTRSLTIDISNYTLTLFSAFEDMVTVELFDEDGDIIYTDWLTPGQTSLTFPGTLSGEYTICLTVGSIYYIGVIEL